MDDNHRLSDGISALEHAEEAVRELHAGCCEPLRSPRMENLSNTLREAQLALRTADNDAAAANVIVLLEDAGAQLGYLQVACCTPARTKLYTSALTSLGKTTRLIKRTFDLDH